MKWRDKDINEPNVFLEEDFYTNVDKNLKIDETLYENKSNKSQRALLHSERKSIVRTGLLRRPDPCLCRLLKSL